MLTGQIIKSTGSWYTVSSNGNILMSRLPGRFRQQDDKLTNPIAVGDFVDASITEDGTGSIEKIYPRKNFIIRKATHGKSGNHLLASNLDYAFVVQSVKNPRLNESFIDRFLVSCASSHVQAGIIINKIDLAVKKDAALPAELKRLYEQLGYQVFLTGINDYTTLTGLMDALKNKTSVFIGPSGVGKTSLLNAMDSSFGLKVGEISDYSGKGKHTTTFAQLVELEFGAKLIDTPGIRELGLVEIETWELSLYYPEMLEHRQRCKFNTCTHYHEPECGVREAFEEGLIAASRYQSYINILESLL